KRANQRRRQVRNIVSDDAETRLVAYSCRKPSWLQGDGRGAEYVLVGAIVHIAGANQRHATGGIRNQLKGCVDKRIVPPSRRAPARDYRAAPCTEGPSVHRRRTAPIEPLRS